MFTKISFFFVFDRFDDDDESPFHSVEMYSPDTNKFVKISSMKIPCSRFTCCNLVHVISGNILTLKQNMLKFIISIQILGLMEKDFLSYQRCSVVLLSIKLKHSFK